MSEECVIGVATGAERLKLYVDSDFHGEEFREWLGERLHVSEVIEPRHLDYDDDYTIDFIFLRGLTDSDCVELKLRWNI